MPLPHMRAVRAGVPALLLCLARIAYGQISLTAPGTPYTQDFNSLATSGTSSVVPAGWAFAETGSNANGTYTAGTGSSNAGDTYSLGASGSPERAFGGLQSGSLIPTIGACFSNNTGVAISRLAVAYTGEQWRLGTSGRGPDRLEFQVGVGATSLVSAVTWTPVPALNFEAPVSVGTVGALDGNAPANRTAVAAAATGLSIPNGTSFCIRWVDFNAGSSDDALGVDDFSLTPEVESGLTVSDLSLMEGNAGTVVAAVEVSLSAPAGLSGVQFNIATSDGTATAGSDYVARSLTGVTIPAGQTTYTFEVAVIGDTLPEPDERFFVTVSGVVGATVADDQGVVTIVNDDLITISQIQGSATESPYTGLVVSTRGIVTGRKSNGFFLQSVPEDMDADPATSEGIFVFTSSAPPANAAPGALVRIDGTVTEFRPSSDPFSPPLTELTSVSGLQVLSTNQPLPAPVAITTAELTPTGGLEQLERFEGMRVRVDTLNVVAPTGGFKDEDDATSVSDGAFYGVLPGTPRPFREPGVELPNPLPPGSPCCVPRWDANPERIRVDSDGQPGATVLNVATGAVVTNLVGPLDYSFRTYTVLPDPPPAAPPSAVGGLTVVPLPAAPADQFTVASFNMERFYDTTDDASVGDVALKAEAFAKRLNKASLTIRNVLRLPDIIGIQEMENLSTLQTLAQKINDDAVLNGSPNPGYTGYLVEGNDPGGIDVAFLVKSSRVSVTGVTQEGKTATYINPKTGTPELLNDRPPLVLQGVVQGSGTSQPVTAIVNHLRSLNDIEDPVDGERVRAKRAAQAEFLAGLIQSRQSTNASEPIIVLGDFNAFEFNDGLVDVVGTVRGAPAPPTEVVKATADLVNPNLANAADAVAPEQRYSYIFRGSAQTLDHILITQNLQPRLAGLQFAHVNADFPEVLRGDSTRPERLSDHDVPVAYFSLPKADLSVAISANTTPVAGKPLSYTVAVVNSAPVAATGLLLTLQLPPQITLQSLTLPSGWSCTPNAPNTTGTISCTKPSLPAATTDTLTVNVLVACAVTNSTTLSTMATVTAQTPDPDPSNNSQTSTTTISNPPPTIANASVDKPVLTPTNGRMVTVNVSYSAADNCGAVSCTLSVASDEPVGRLPDWEVVSPTQVRLRAQALFNGDGRVYTITITCVDGVGNTSQQTVTVQVPKRRP